MDIANRFNDNPLIAPKDVPPSAEGLIVECVLNPGVYAFDGRIHLLMRVAERLSHCREVKEWHQVYVRNEQLDCRVYAMAALKLLPTNTLDRLHAKRTARREDKTEDKPKKKRPARVRGQAWAQQI